MALPRSLAPLRHRPFALLWSGAFVSNIGRWMESVAVGVLVTETTGQARWTGLVAVAAFAPNAVMSPIGGALADRFHRRRLILVVMTLQTALAILLTVLAARGEASPGVVTLVVLAAGCIGALGFPAYQALLPDLVPKSDLPGAVALAGAQWNLGRVVGPALAGVAIGAGGYEWAFGFNAVSFLAVIPVIALLPLPPHEPPDRDSILGSIRSGFRYATEEPGIRAAVVYMCFTSFLAAPFIGLIAAVAIKVFDAGSAGTAALVTGQGVGAVVVALSFGSLVDRHGPRGTLTGSVWLLPPVLVAYALAPTIELATVGVFLVGAVYMAAFSSFTTIAQLRAPPHLRGRVMSLLMMILGILFPLGSLLQGAIGDRIGLRATTVGAAVLLAGTAVLLRVRRPGLAAALDIAEPEPVPDAVSGGGTEGEPSPEPATP
ncbi:MAG: MFS transporter [Acidimicrobiia bacterium]|nr:MFS transporter [Acidimicrobiia bacterium]